MGGCSAIKCFNHSRNKFRMFIFPANEARRTRYLINCQRDGRIPGPRAELCSVHFEESGMNSIVIPTLFDVPNPPAVFASKRIKGIGLPKSGSVLDKTSVDDEEVSREDLIARIQDLEEENKKLKLIIEENK